MVAGFLTYISVYDPLTGEGTVVFEYFTASLPSVVVTAIVYWVLSVCWIQPQGLGGYASAKKSRALDVADREIGF